ncbi:MAG TPA: hypothetical protein VGR71_09030, partial [Nitrospira sp.]|nr:hypothetical protein [Nitrospira sp.]
MDQQVSVGGIDWQRPDPASLALRWTVATSTLDQFVLDHDHLDVLRELVQNEYDAHGRSLEINFEEDHLEVVGSGDPIDRDGWRRLSVMLGTGKVPDTAYRIKPKENSLGSKNFGLKSLFLIGDTIYIRSAGQQTVIDRLRGAPARPFPDLTSKPLRGIRITVPYRPKADGGFPAFDIPTEEIALGEISGRLSSVLLRLANPKGVHSLNRVTVRSARLGRKLEWSQQATTLNLTTSGAVVIDRRVHLRGVPPSAGLATALREIEFQKVSRPPSSLRPDSIPSYFARSGGRIAVGIGFRVRGRTLDTNHLGTNYYPLEAEESYTGCAVNISAPFVMSSDRSQLQDAATHGWNAWLLRFAAGAAVALLPALYEEFGASAFAAWRPRSTASSDIFMEQAANELRQRTVWPSAARYRGKRPVYKAAEDVAIPADQRFAPLMGDEFVLDPPVASMESAAKVATAVGCKAFGVSSAVVLRCGPSPSIKTKLLDGELALHYTDFPKEIRSPEVQHQYAKAFDAPTQLTSEHITDLRLTSTTLTAAGTLAAAAELYAVDKETGDIASLSKKQRLHPVLITSRLFKMRLAKRFSLQDWVVSASARAETDETQRKALYRFILSQPRISSKAWGRLRRAPVLLDSVGNWAPGEHILLPEAGVPKSLASAFHLARTEYARNAMLAKRLGFRRRLRGRDLVHCARRITTDVESREFQALLKKYRRLLTRPLIREMSAIAFLPASDGELAKPSELYVLNKHNHAVLGDSARYAQTADPVLAGLLGCKTEPDSQGIIQRLNLLRAEGLAIQEWELVYGALITAFQKERRSPRVLSDQSILEVDGRWWRPNQILVGRAHARTFLD